MSGENEKSFFSRLKRRWQVEKTSQVMMILLIFALTGTTVLLLKKPFLHWLFPDGNKPVAFTIAYYILILPFYNLLLLIYGFILGQFSFFWNFEKRMFKRILGRKSG